MRLVARYPRLVAFIASALIPVPCYVGSRVFLLDSIFVPVLVDLLLGYALGVAVSRASPLATPVGVAAAAVFGVLLPWLLLVVLTMGFALVAFPLLLIYAGLVYWAVARTRQKFAAEVGVGERTA